MLGVLHSVSHAICSIYDIHHDLNCGVGLLRVMDYNKPAMYHRYRDLAQAAGVDTRNLTNPQCADRLIKETIQLIKDVAANLSGSTATNYTKSRVGGQEGAGGQEDN